MTIKEVVFEGKEYQGWNEWSEKFKPEENHIVTSNELMFETYGEELEYVRSMDPRYVWTWVQGDLSDLIVAGYHLVNRLGYYVTEVPWDNEWDSCLLSVEVECECYNEDGYDDNGGEYGKADCTKCEGYGYVTSYV